MNWFEDEDFWRQFYPVMFDPGRFEAAPEQISQILALAKFEGRKILDLCCGAGRHSVEFAKRGFEVTGVDLSTFLLDKARERAAGAAVKVEWVQQDMRNFVRPGAFDLACSLFTSFGYFEREEDELLVLRNIHASLREGGIFVIDVVSKEKMALNWQNTICVEYADGSLWVQRPHVLEGWSRIRNDWTLVNDGIARSYSFEHFVYSGRELKDRLLTSGFGRVELFGDLTGAPYGLDATRLIAAAHK